MSRNPMKTTVIDNRAEWDRTFRRLEQVYDVRVTAGIHEEDNEANRSDRPNHAALLFIHMTGQAVPKRDAVRPTWDRKERIYGRQAEGIVGKAIDGQVGWFEGFDALGKRIAADLQNAIVKLQEPENAPQTIAEKESANPLIASGDMKNAVDSRVHLD